MTDIEKKTDEENSIAYVADYPTPSTGEKAILGLVGVVIVGFLGLVTWTSIKEEQKRAEESRLRREKAVKRRQEREAWCEEQRKDGRVVVELRSGEYMAVSADAYAQAEIRGY